MILLRGRKTQQLRKIGTINQLHAEKVEEEERKYIPLCNTAKKTKKQPKKNPTIIKFIKR